MNFGEALANWRCVCGRHASIEHSIGGYCAAKEIIEKLESKNKALAEQVATLRDALERISKQDSCDADYEEGGPCLGTCPKSIAKQALSESERVK